MFHRHPLLSLVTGAYLVFVGWLTLSPQSSVTPTTDVAVRLLDALHRRGYARSIGYSEMEHLANVALFVPVGIFLLLLFGAGGWWLAALASFAMTGGIEYAQHYIPGRVPDARDLQANGLGALIGIGVALVLTLPATLRRRRRRRLRALAA
jgi:VanZ family protein